MSSLTLTGIGNIVAGGGGGFSPDDIAGLVFWGEASEESGYSDSDPVGTVTDQSGQGNNLTQATEAKKPLYKASIYNSQPCYRFQDSGDFLENTSTTGIPTVDTAYTEVVVIAHSTTTIASHFIACIGSGGTNTATNLVVSTGGDGSHKDDMWFGDFNSGGAWAGFTGLDDGSPHLWIRTYAGSAADHYPYVDNSVGTNDNFGANNRTSEITLGGLPGGGSGFANGADVCAYLIYNKALDADERQDLWDHFSVKYGI